MVFAIAQFGDFEGDFFLFFLGLLFHRGELFSQLLIEKNPIDDLFADLWILVEKILHGIFDFLTIGARISLLDNLFFVWDSKTGSLTLTKNGADDPLAHIDPLKVFLGVLIDPFEDSLSKSRKMGSSVLCVLPVHKRKVGFSVA